ncbi:copine-8 [Eurytemora carolleeae]|uniref:copine-8 n=1 Tax=Eurytemora carolleeae TaxID=1294199 RepID=UPI000C77B040|nr:copine-8 [Eurytemora carolleeae]|eukprot:XP_023339051.1 copine-8-like [Eurytemora affinis]
MSSMYGGVPGGGGGVPGGGVPGFQSGVSSTPSSTVELSLSCSNLRNADFFSKSDPFVVIQIKVPKSQTWTEIFRSETIQDTLNPIWQKKIVMEYRFEERQFLKFLVFDRDSPSNNLQDENLQVNLETDPQQVQGSPSQDLIKEHDFLGSLETTLGEIVAKQSSGYTKLLTDGGNGTISIVAEEMMSCKEEIILKLGAKKLKSMNWFLGKSDPFLEISRCTENNTYILVHRTEVIKKTLNPNWKSFQLKVGTLCNGDYERDLKVDIYDWESSGTHQYMGTFHTNLRKLSEGPGSSNIYDVVSKKGKKDGTVEVQEARIEIVPTFLDYIKGGLQLNFTVAVDFTASNGNPSDPRSLHYRDPSGRPNQYITAIQSVGEIIQVFIIIIRKNSSPPIRLSLFVSHEFYLNLSTSPYCSGVDGILAAYFNALYNVQLYGPTNFAPVIRHVTNFAQAHQHDNINYFVLLIITDGVISDMDETKRAIINASRLPLSIIIVGVGNEDFSSMDELDSDESLLELGNMKAARDIVQFVELQRFLSPAAPGLPGVGWSKDLLAREVLAELPDQVVGYMKSKGVQPGPPRASAPV